MKMGFYRRNLSEEEGASPKGQGIPFWESMQAKFSLCSLVILMIVLILLNIYPLYASQTSLVNSKKITLKRQVSVISSVLMELETLTPNGVERVMQTLRPTGLSRIVVTDPHGVVLYDISENESGVMPFDSAPQVSGKVALTQEVYLALLGYDVTNTSFTLDNIYSNTAVPVVYGDNTIGAIYIHEEDEVQGQLLRSLRENLLLISWVAAAIASLLYGIFSMVFTNRIKALLTAIQIVGAGDYGHRLVPKGKDEMSYLAQEFNTLTDRLQSTEEVRRRFVSDASHELRTPLASIQLLADSILHNDQIPPEMVREFVSDICAESGRLSRITERLLNLSKLDSLPAPVAEAVGVNQVLLKVIQSLDLVSEEGGVDLRFFPEEEELYVHCTPDKFHQICYNLLENAIKYTPVGGFAQVSLRVEGGEVVMEVADNGLGIPSEDLPKIFNRFYRVDDARSREAGGTGLGLAIVRDTLRAYGGWVEARNNSPCGTVFAVGLPQEKAENTKKSEGQKEEKP